MTEHRWLQSLFKSIDNKDAAAFVEHLDDNCSFRFGNMPAVHGTESIVQAVTAFFDSINSVSHEIVDSWSATEQVTCHGMVTYHRLDGGVLTVPFANIMKRKAGSERIHEYLIFADTSELYR